jgi:hypothetical protein
LAWKAKESDPKSAPVEDIMLQPSTSPSRTGSGHGSLPLFESSLSRHQELIGLGTGEFPLLVSHESPPSCRSFLGFSLAVNPAHQAGPDLRPPRGRTGCASRPVEAIGAVIMSMEARATLYMANAHVIGSESGREVPAGVGTASQFQLHTSAIVGRAPESCAQQREIRLHVSSVGSRLHPLPDDGREGRSPCIMRMRVRPSVKPSKRTRPAYSCHHSRHVCRRR